MFIHLLMVSFLRSSEMEMGWVASRAKYLVNILTASCSIPVGETETSLGI